MSLKLPKIIGHRGAAAYAPENTIEGIHTAADMGIEWVELDVKLTKDQVPVIFHDDTLERTTNGAGVMAETTYEDLRQLEAGSWYGESFAGIKIPSLEEALEAIIDRGLGLNLEIKPCPGREKETAEVALDILSHFWDDHDRLLISSFEHVSLETAMDMAGDWHRGLLLRGTGWPKNWAEMAAYLEVSTININGNKCGRTHVETAAKYGKPVLAYTVNDPERARILQGWGVRCFFSDAPDVIKEALMTVH
jgi:glycerophosphoryl diester phosphodiesterase